MGLVLARRAFNTARLLVSVPGGHAGVASECAFNASSGFNTNEVCF